MDCVLWCMLVRVSVYLQIISLSLKVRTPTFFFLNCFLYGYGKAYLETFRSPDGKKVNSTPVQRQLVYIIVENRILIHRLGKRQCKWIFVIIYRFSQG